MANQQSKNIQYSGLTTLPDDYQSVDGSLAFATNAVYEDNAVKIIPPALAKNLIVEKGDKVYVHSMATYTHYIVAHEGSDGVTLYWVDEKSCEEKKVYCVTDAENGVDNNPDVEGIELGPVFTIGTYAGTFVDLAFVGNTMILSTSESLQYILWKADDSTYLYLGDKIPTVSIQWGLNLTLGRSVYLNTGITTETKDNLSSGEGYETVGMCNYNHRRVVASNYDFTPLNDAHTNKRDDGSTVMKLNKDTKYRAYQYVTSSKKASPNIHGVDSSGGDKNLCDIPEKSKDYKYFTAKNDYERAYLRVQQRKSSGVVYVDGTTNTTSVNATQIKDDSNDGQNNFTAIMGYMNKFVNEQGKRNDRFIYPFMLRYAVKLYDGSWCNLSTPILLYPNTGYAPFMRVIHQSGFTDVEAYAFTAGLHYELRPDSLGKFIGKEWEDIVLGVGVFVSQQVYPYDQGASWEAGVSSYNYLYSNNQAEYLDDDKTQKNPKYVNDIKGTSYGIGDYDGATTDGSLGSSGDSGDSDDETNDVVSVEKDENYSYFGYLSDSNANNETIIAYVTAENEDGTPYALAVANVSVDTGSTPVSVTLTQKDENTVQLAITRNNADDNVAGNITLRTTVDNVVYTNTLYVSTKYNSDRVAEYTTGDFTVIDANDPLSFYGYNIVASNNGDAVATVQIAKKKQGEIQDEILNICNFYKIGEIDFEDLLADDYSASNLPSVDFEMEEGTLNSLEARETLKEEEVSVNGFQGANLFVYNNRLHISGGTRSLPSMTSTLRQNGKITLPDWFVPKDADGKEKYLSAVMIRTDEGARMVTSNDVSLYLAPWFFYPDTRAYQYIEFLPEAYHKPETETDDDGNTTETGRTLDCIVYDLKTHDFLNGSYLLRDAGRFCRAVLDESDADVDYGSDAEEDVFNDADANDKVSNLNKIYASEASNPFVFKNSMVCTAGSGQVLALSSAAKALSQGQFGQFPLYAFTDEGIWAMSVGSTGAYETVQPIARDVVQEDAVKAITQLDSAVVFVTNRGVMLVEGSNVVCMSDDIDGDFGQFDPRTLSDFYDIMRRHLGFSTDDTDNTIGKWASQAFFDFIRSCQMKYDYVHQRITMYSDDCDIAYVYSLKSKQWLMQLTALQDNVNSYPDAYALRNTEGITYEGENGEEVSVDCTELVNLSEYDLETERLPMVFVTRPFKLDAPDTFKTVNDIIQRGYFRQDEKIKHIIGTVLYGSPDLFNWFTVKSNVGSKVQNLHGSPYKYFRALVVSQLDAKEGISGCSVWFEPKDTQRMR